LIVRSFVWRLTALLANMGSIVPVERLT